jgi:hypothetical protein
MSGGRSDVEFDRWTAGAKANMLVLKHKSFQPGRRIWWSKRDIIEGHERLREEAENFINSSIGADKVVSVTERLHEVTVWYRDDAAKSLKAVTPEV